jgi:hypothetical protein
MLSVSRLYIVHDGRINERGAVGGVRIDGGDTHVFAENPPQYHFFHHKSHVT